MANIRALRANALSVGQTSSKVATMLALERAAQGKDVVNDSLFYFFSSNVSEWPLGPASADSLTDEKNKSVVTTSSFS